MHIIRIPTNVNKYSYVLNILNLLQNIFNEYTFVNCTQSPIDEFEYSKNDSVYYRELKKIQRPDIDEFSYMNPYQKDNLKKGGFTLKEYVEMCLLFELDRIEIVKKDPSLENQTNQEAFNTIATLLICPDGLNEIHISGSNTVLNKLVASLPEI